MKLNPRSKSQKSFTIIELLAVMIIGSILLLSVGVISIIAMRSHENYRRESQVYNDISYGFELIKNRVRRTTFAPDTLTDTPPWVGKALVVEYLYLEDDGTTTKRTETFGVQQQGCVTDFVYTESSGVTHTISANLIDATFDPTISGNEVRVPLVGRVEVSGDGDCTWNEPGEKYESFDLTTHITRRNP